MADASIPTISINSEGKITLSIPQTQAKLNDQGYTYNQAGFTYNQASLIQYGGVYFQNQDVVPLLSVAKLEQPSLSILPEFMTLSSPKMETALELSFTDLYSVTTIGKNQSIGPGWFMWVTH